MKLYILYSKKMILAAMLKINYKGTRLEARGQQGGQSRRGMPVAWSLGGGGGQQWWQNNHHHDVDLGSVYFNYQTIWCIYSLSSILLGMRIESNSSSYL